MLITDVNQYKIGLEPIDSQHIELFGDIDKLQQLIAHERPNQAHLIQQLINDIINKASLHFRSEEAHFDKLCSEDKQAHLLQHKFFLQDSQLYLHDLIHKKIAAHDLLYILTDWFFNHFQEYDVKLTPKSEPIKTQPN